MKVRGPRTGPCVCVPAGSLEWHDPSAALVLSALTTPPAGLGNVVASMKTHVQAGATSPCVCRGPLRRAGPGHSD